jgi:hypothetical protein
MSFDSPSTICFFAIRTNIEAPLRSRTMMASLEERPAYRRDIESEIATFILFKSCRASLTSFTTQGVQLGGIRCLVRYEADGYTNGFGEPSNKTEAEEGDFKFVKLECRVVTVKPIIGLCRHDTVTRRFGALGTRLSEDANRKRRLEWYVYG